jgi:hypothetical protein
MFAANLRQAAKRKSRIQMVRPFVFGAMND